MENLLQITAIAILAEAVWENLKMIWQDGKVSIDRIGALIVSIVISMATQLDVFAILNFGISIPFVGSFLTGILISRGANFIHDLLNKIQTISNSYWIHKNNRLEKNIRNTANDGTAYMSIDIVE